ncbi:hypothetical protein [Solirubrum puertoriconensis]|uniref:Uncharacterized protein n=1 Tax=Solirubrum puertoriconensis TaxID=1751427 RepID=A0A9X0HK85_SOLP1|nr:hypothetical protein [Solirubrum puertoriconensis]KUG07445.1 hypothetical protein ASU33_13915 [Solirubrum puertoriconensis]
MPFKEELLVPSAIDIPLVLNSLGFSDEYINHHADKYNYVLDKIYETRIYNRIGADGFSNLPMKNQREFLGRRYADDIVKNLLTWGYIQTDGYYIQTNEKKGIKGKALGYRIAPAYQSKGVFRMVLNEKFEAKLRKHQLDYTKQHLKNRYWANLKKLTIEEAAAQAYIDAKLECSLELLESWKPTLTEVTTVDAVASTYPALKTTWKSAQAPVYSLTMVQQLQKAVQRKVNEGMNAYDLLLSNLHDQHSSDQKAIRKIATQKYFFHQPDKLSRVYTNLSNLSTDLRNFLRHQDDHGAALVNLDIRNSQPYLLSLLLIDHYRGQVLPEDVQQYIHLTATGKFYDFVMDSLEVTENRKAFKVQFFASVFFCTNHYSARTEEGKWFRKQFPNVAALVERNKQGNHANLAILMQRREAGIILQTIGKELQRRDIWYQTIHDSIVVLAKDAQQAKELILEAFFNEVGVAPTVEEDVFTTGPKSVQMETTDIYSLAMELMNSWEPESDLLAA